MLVLSCGDSFVFYFYAFTLSKSKQELAKQYDEYIERLHRQTQASEPKEKQQTKKKEEVRAELYKASGFKEVEEEEEEVIVKKTKTKPKKK